MERIMVVEDDQDIRKGVKILLESQGYCVDEAGNGKDALSLFNDKYMLLIVDIRMPEISGIELCKEIRKKSYVPILFLTAKSAETDKIEGFSAGGDDYLVKPFSYVELIARVKALIRRSYEYNIGNIDRNCNDKKEWLRIGNLSINRNRNDIKINEEEFNLTEKEYEILLLFLENKEKIFSVENIYESVWKEEYIYSSSNTVMVHIKNIRSKLEKSDFHAGSIRTVWGKGYKFEG